MRRITAAERNILIICLIVILGSITWIVFEKVLLRFSLLEEENTVAGQKLSGLINILERKDDLELEYNNKISNLKRIKDSNDLILIIQNFAQESGVNIQNIKPTRTKEEPLCKTYSVYVEARGEILALAKLLNAFEDSKVIAVDSLNIRSENFRKAPEIILSVSAVNFE